MKAFKSLLEAHYKQFVRDKAALFFTFVFPIMFILIFGWAFSDPDLQTFDIGLVIQDASEIAEGVSVGLASVEIDDKEIFEVEEGTESVELQALRDGDLDAVIILLDGFGNALVEGQPTSIQVHYDPSQNTTQQTLLPILNHVMAGIEGNITGNERLISIEEHSMQSHQLRYIDYLVPGVLGMSLMFTGIYGCMPIIQQRQAHIIKRLGCTPLRRSTLVFSELVFRMVIVLLTAALIVLVGRLVFDVQMVGNWASLCGIIILGTLVFVAMGYVIAAFIRTEEGAIPIINVITFPMMFLSGTFFPVDSFPSWLEPVVTAFPLTYFADALRQIMVAGAPLHAMTTDVLVMGVWLIVSLAITIRFFRWD